MTDDNTEQNAIENRFTSLQQIAMKIISRLLKTVLNYRCYVT